MLLAVLIMLMSCESRSSLRSHVVQSQLKVPPTIVIMDETQSKSGQVITLFRCNNAYYLSTSSGGIVSVNIEKLY